MKRLKIFFMITILISCFSCKKEIYADILIKNGTVYNGVDSIPNYLSIAIKDDKIIFIGDENTVSIKASKIIDATGLLVSPGFIDPHTHADRDLIDPETSHNKPFLFQGVTTVVVGNDGDSFYPTSKYKNLYETQGIGTNAVLLFGHGTIREQVIGRSDRKATAHEISKMQSLVQQEMNAGAFGISTGLFYAPGSYANTDEVIALAKTVAKNKGIYDTHLRDESSYTVGLIPSIEEAIEIGRQAKLPIHISHIKCLGVDVWHQSDSIISIINSARKAGIEVTANQYPYDASATGLQAAVVPRWTESGGKDSVFIRFDNPKLKQRILAETKINIIRRGGPEKLLIVKSDDSIRVGKNLLEISETLGLSPEEAVFKILRTSSVKIASFNMNFDDISNFMKQDWVVTGSDGNTGHPRKYGTFPRKYQKYVKQDNSIGIATFINGSTSKTADIFRIPNRGKLLEGYYADIVIFNPEIFKDKADYSDAFQLAEGLEFSLINGKLSIENGKFTEQLNGKVLKK
ncbi:MAG: N-acyl-D-amino-acid deacylase [Mariniflexile sp.]|jgi:N-acyl-D-amino-acid deacylase